MYLLPRQRGTGFAKNVLQKTGIYCVEINEQVAQLISSPPFQAELWVEREEDYGEAMALMEAWQHPSPEAEALWNCSRCGEQLSRQFSKCWKCGASRCADA